MEEVYKIQDFQTEALVLRYIMITRRIVQKEFYICMRGQRLLSKQNTELKPTAAIAQEKCAYLKLLRTLTQSHLQNIWLFLQ